MPKLTGTKIPSYRLHKQSGQAIVTLNGRDCLLGTYGTPESQDKYNRLIAEWIAGGRQSQSGRSQATISELLTSYWSHVETYYRRADGTPTDETKCIKKALGPLRR